MRFHTLSVTKCNLAWPHTWSLKDAAVFVFNLTTCCMASLILLLYSDGSLTSKFRLWTGEMRKAPRVKHNPWWCTMSSSPIYKFLWNRILYSSSLAMTELRFDTPQAEHLWTGTHIYIGDSFQQLNRPVGVAKWVLGDRGIRRSLVRIWTSHFRTLVKSNRW